MMSLDHTALRTLALKVLAQRTGPATGGEAVAEAALRAHEDLARVISPLIGQAGVAALTARAVHLAQQEHSWLGSKDEPATADEPFTRILTPLARQDPAVATEGAAALFAILGGLLVTFIGEPLTASLLQKAWPRAFSDVYAEEI